MWLMAAPLDSGLMLETAEAEPGVPCIGLASQQWGCTMHASPTSCKSLFVSQNQYLSSLWVTFVRVRDSNPIYCSLKDNLTNDCSYNKKVAIEILRMVIKPHSNFSHAFDHCSKKSPIMLNNMLILFQACQQIS